MYKDTVDTVKVRFGYDDETILNPCYRGLSLDLRGFPSSKLVDIEDNMLGKRFVEGTEEYFYYLTPVANYPELGYEPIEKDGRVYFYPTDELCSIKNRKKEDFIIKSCTKEEYVKAREEKILAMKTVKEYYKPYLVTTAPFGNILNALDIDNRPTTIEAREERDVAIHKIKLQTKCSCKCIKIEKPNEHCRCKCHDVYKQELKYIHQTEDNTDLFKGYDIDVLDEEEDVFTYTETELDVVKKSESIKKFDVSSNNNVLYLTDMPPDTRTPHQVSKDNIKDFTKVMPREHENGNQIIHKDPNHYTKYRDGKIVDIPTFEPSDEKYLRSTEYLEYIGICKEYGTLSDEALEAVVKLRVPTMELAEKLSVVTNDEDVLPKTICMYNTSDGVVYSPGISFGDVYFKYPSILTTRNEFDLSKYANIMDYWKHSYKDSTGRDVDTKGLTGIKESLKNYPVQKLTREEMVDMETSKVEMGFSQIPDFIDIEDDLDYEVNTTPIHVPNENNVIINERKFLFEFDDTLKAYDEDVKKNIFINRNLSPSEIKKSIQEQLSAPFVDVSDDDMVRKSRIISGDDYVEVGHGIPMGDNLYKHTFVLKRETEEEELYSYTNKFNRMALIEHRLNSENKVRREIMKTKTSGDITFQGLDMNIVNRASDKDQASRIAKGIKDTYYMEINDDNSYMNKISRKRKAMKEILSEEEIRFNNIMSLILNRHIELSKGGISLSDDLPDYIIKLGPELETLLKDEEFIDILTISAELADKIETKLDMDVSSFLETVTLNTLNSKNFIVSVSAVMQYQRDKLNRKLVLTTMLDSDYTGTNMSVYSENVKKIVSDLADNGNDVLSTIGANGELTKENIANTPDLNSRRNKAFVSMLRVLNAELTQLENHKTNKAIGVANKIINSNVAVSLPNIVSLFKAHEYNVRYSLSLDTSAIIADLLAGVLDIRKSQVGESDLSRGITNLAVHIVDNPSLSADELRILINNTLKNNTKTTSYYLNLTKDEFKATALRSEDILTCKTPNLIDANLTTNSRIINFIEETIYSIRKIIGKEYFKAVTSSMVVGSTDDSVCIEKRIKDTQEKLDKIREMISRKESSINERIVLDSGKSADFEAIEGMGTDKIIYKTGFHHINKSLKGGLRSGDLVVIGALSSNYKTGTTMAMFISVMLYNKAPKLKGQKTYAQWISLEDDPQLILRQMAQFVYFAIHRIHIHADSLSAQDCFNIVSDEALKNGWTFMFTRENPSSTGYRQIFNIVENIEDDGHSVGLVVIDYVAKMITDGCVKGAIGADKVDLTSRLRFFFASRNCLFMTPWQLGPGAGNLLKNGIESPDLVREVLNKPYYKEVTNLNTEIDTEIIANKTHGEDGGRDFLTLGRGKAKATKGVKSSELVRHYPFTPYGPLEYDVILKTVDGIIQRDEDLNPISTNCTSSTTEPENIDMLQIKRNKSNFYADGHPDGFKKGVTDGEELTNSYLVKKKEEEEAKEKEKQKQIATDDLLSVEELHKLEKKREELYNKAQEEAKDKIKDELIKEGIQYALYNTLAKLANGEEVTINEKDYSIVANDRGIAFKTPNLDEYVKLFLSKDGKFKTYDELLEDNDYLTKRKIDNPKFDINDVPLTKHNKNNNVSVKPLEMFNLMDGETKADFNRRVKNVEDEIMAMRKESIYDSIVVQKRIESAWNGYTSITQGDDDVMGGNELLLTDNHKHKGLDLNLELY